VDKELGSGPSAKPAPLEQVKHSVHSDLQYVSIQIEGKIYGGWYRTLADGQMELLALANMHCERRFENTPIEQARGMLTDFIRVARPTQAPGESPAVITNNSLDIHTDEERRQGTGTLGDLLYADKAKARVAEKNWVGLLRCIAAGDQLALHELYERTHRIVFTLFVRLTNDPETAEELTLDVFHDAWRRAAQYDAAGGSVVGWIMNRARARAVDHARFESWKGRGNILANCPSPLNASSVSAASERPTDVLRPSQSLWARLAQRIEAKSRGGPVSSTTLQWQEPEWEEVAPGISCQLFATDAEQHRVTMLVRLAPGIQYPPHRHAGVEELHLLYGELHIDERKLHAGGYNRAEPGTADRRVWSETGCTCVLMTSTQDLVS